MAKVRFPQLQNRAWLVAEYYEKERPMADIARELGCSSAGVRSALLRHDIRLRGQGAFPTGPVDLTPVLSRTIATPRAGCRCDRPLHDEEHRCVKCGR